MVNRRSALKIGATTLAGALVGRPGLGKNARSARCAFQRAVFDERFEECRAFGAELRRAGVFTSEIGTDVGKLWYGDLQARLSQAPAPIAGLTDRGTLFCLEELARSVGMRVRYRVDHSADSSGHVQHDAVGPAWTVEAASKLSSGSGYGRAMAVLASQFDSRESSETAAQKRTGPFAPQDKTVLVSWVIA